jgi:uncharacterized protein
MSSSLAAQNPSSIPGEASADPSMEDILASIRRILNDDGSPMAVPPAETAMAEEEDDGVLVLDASMMVAPEPSSPPPEMPPPAMPPVEMLAPEVPALEVPAPPPAPPGALLAGETEMAAAASVSQLVRSLNTERLMPVYRGGPTLEDMVLESMRPMLKAWLDQNLPPMVERLVRAEIERVAARALAG